MTNVYAIRPARALTVVIADETPMVRTGLRAALSTVDGVTVAAEADSATAAVRECTLHRPQVLIVDSSAAVGAVILGRGACGVENNIER